MGPSSGGPEVLADRPMIQLKCLRLMHSPFPPAPSRMPLPPPPLPAAAFVVSRANPAVPSSPMGSTARRLALGPKRRFSVFEKTRAVPSDLSSLLFGLKTSLKAHGAK